MSLKPERNAPIATPATPAQITLKSNKTETDAPKPRRPLVLIEGETANVRLDLHDFWAQRELLYFLTWRDIKVRYKQTLMGAAWVIIQPLFTMLIVAFVLGRLAGLDGDGIPYPLFAYAGVLLWTYFSNAVSNSTLSLVQNTNLITKVYFPRPFIPAAATAAGLVDLAIASLLLIGFLFYYRVIPTWEMLLLPVFVVQLVLLALATGLFISALTVKYRDLRHVLPFLLQFWFFATPVIYPLSKTSGKLYWLLAANPVTGIIEGFRAAIAGRPMPLRAIALSVVVTLGLSLLSIYTFRRLEATFADVI